MTLALFIQLIPFLYVYALNQMDKNSKITWHVQAK